MDIKTYLTMKQRLMSKTQTQLSIEFGKDCSFFSRLQNGLYTISEEVSNEIAKFFGDDPLKVYFIFRGIPAKIKQMIAEDEDVQNYLIKKHQDKQRKGE